MFIFAIRRLLAAIPTLLLSTFIIFISVSITQDPRSNVDFANTDSAAYAEIEELYNLDKPKVVRYGMWLKSAATGDLGEALSQGERPVTEVLQERGKNTFLLAAPSFVLLTTLGALAGVYSALKQYSKTDYLISLVSYFGLAMPTFFFGLLLQVVGGIWINQTFGFKPFFVTGMHLDSPLTYIQSVTLPAITLMLVFLAGDSRFIRASVLEIKRSDYVRTARAKGISERQVVWRHIWRNTIISAVTLWTLKAATLFGGTIVTETVFSWPGFGRLIFDSIDSSDLDLLMGVTVIITGLVITTNLIADLLYGVLDPRVRYE